MPSRAIKPRREEDQTSEGGGWKGLSERAPSLVRPDQGTVARVIALIALFPLTLGAAALFFGTIGRSITGRGYLISPSWGVLLLVLGLAGILYHAFNEKDLQYRRLYWVVGLALLAAGVVLRLLPSEAGLGGQTFLPYGAPALLLALGFLGSAVRNETDPVYRRVTVNGVGAVGAVCALVGFVGGLISETFLLGQGVVLLLLGLLYLGAYIGLQESGSDRAYWIGLGVGVLGGAMVLVALGWSFLPPLLADWHVLSAAPSGSFFMPRGLILLYLGLEYLLLSVLVCSDSQLIVLMRRELLAYFYSPVAYVVLICVALLGWFIFNSLFLPQLIHQRGGLEPIVRNFTTWYIQAFAPVLVVPLLTMGLLSEERRTGSLEMLLTAPVKESTVVLAKFFAVLRVFILVWYSWGLYLLALRVEGGEPFDYRPLLTFFVSLIFMGAGWLALGLFFSSLTRSLIAAAIVTLVAMLGLALLFWARMSFEEGGTWYNILAYVSYIELWINSSSGTLAPRVLLFHLSFAIFFLFLTVKVLEARKWT
jgi:ABC-type transport system involved in multi-copper enzyme maturation permease subunit